MAQRGVTEAQVERVLASPSVTMATPKNSIRYEGTFPDGRTLKVWVVDNDDQTARKVVKSVAWKGEDDE